MIPPVAKRPFDGAVPEPKHEGKGSLFEALPQEILEMILSHLPIRQIPALASVNQSMRRDCQSVVVRQLLNKRQLPLRRFGITSVWGVLKVFKALGEELKYLKVVNLRGIDVDNTELAMITELTPRLSRLYLANFCSYPCLSIKIRNINSLSTLSFVCNEDGLLLVREEILSRVKKLRIRNNFFFRSSHLQTIGVHATNLKKLDLGGCDNVNNSSFGELSERITTLTTLKLTPNICSSEPGLEKLVNANPNLSTLKFFRSPTLDLEPLQPFSKITKFSMYRVNKKSVAWYEKLADYLPNVRDLCFNYCDDLTSFAAANFAEKCTRLVRLDLSFCDVLDDQVVLHLEKNFSRIISLSLQKCELSDTSLALIGTKGTNIQTLKIGYNDSITDAGIIAFCRGSQSLREIDLQCCRTLTGVALDSLLCSQTGLTSINFSINPLPYRSFKALVQSNTSLKKLSLIYCLGLTDLALTTLLGAHRNLSTLKLSFIEHITIRGLLTALRCIKCLEELEILFDNYPDAQTVTIYKTLLQKIKEILPYCEVRSNFEALIKP